MIAKTHTRTGQDMIVATARDDRSRALAQCIMFGGRCLMVTAKAVIYAPDRVLDWAGKTRVSKTKTTTAINKSA